MGGARESRKAARAASARPAAWGLLLLSVGVAPVGVMPVGVAGADGPAPPTGPPAEPAVSAAAYTLPETIAVLRIRPEGVRLAELYARFVPPPRRPTAAPSVAPGPGTAAPDGVGPSVVTPTGPPPSPVPGLDAPAAGGLAPVAADVPPSVAAADITLTMWNRNFGPLQVFVPTTGPEASHAVAARRASSTVEGRRTVLSGIAALVPTIETAKADGERMVFGPRTVVNAVLTPGRADGRAWDEALALYATATVAWAVIPPAELRDRVRAEAAQFAGQPERGPIPVRMLMNDITMLVGGVDVAAATPFVEVRAYCEDDAAAARTAATVRDLLGLAEMTVEADVAWAARRLTRRAVVRVDANVATLRLDGDAAAREALAVIVPALLNGTAVAGEPAPAPEAVTPGTVTPAAVAPGRGPGG